MDRQVFFNKFNSLLSFNLIIMLLNFILQIYFIGQFLWRGHIHVMQFLIFTQDSSQLLQMFRCGADTFALLYYAVPTKS